MLFVYKRHSNLAQRIINAREPLQAKNTTTIRFVFSHSSFSFFSLIFGYDAMTHAFYV